jgi:alpha-beta hydrolase superfamily lysophospholipase
MPRAVSHGFVLTYRGREFVRQWVDTRESTSPGDTCLRFYWETDWEVVGGRQKAGGAILCTDPAGRPVRYDVMSADASLARAEFRPDGARITLRDGSTRLLSLPEPPSLVFESNILLMLSAALSQWAGDQREIEAPCFLPGALRNRRVTFVEDPHRHWTCDLGLSFDVDDELRLLGAATRDPEVGGRPLARPFPSEAFSRLETRQASLYRPPDDRRFEPLDVEVPGPVPLGATLCVPAAAPRGGVLFLKGSGRQDRHGFVEGIDTGAHAICDALANAGFVTLRFDARGAGTTGFGNPFQPMLAAREEDARAALAWLAARAEVGARRIVVVAHSIGAVTALRLASDPALPQVRALALLAPPGRPLELVLSEQAEREARRLEMSVEAERRRADLVAHTLDREAASAEDERARIDEYSSVDAMSALRDEFRADPADDIRRVRVPVILCYGGSDMQVDAVRDGARLQSAARDAGVSCELRTYESLDHLFRESSRASFPESYFRPLPVDPAFLEDLVGWLGRVP